MNVLKTMVAGALALGASISLMPIGSAFAQAQEWKLRLQSFSAKGPDAQWVSVEKLLDFIREETDGKVDIRAYPAGQFVPTPEIYAAVSKGVIDAGTLAGNYIFGQHPSADWAGLPIIESRDEWFKVMDGGGREYVSQQLAKDGVSVLAYYPLDDMSVFALSSGPIKTTEDLKGKRMRGISGVTDEFMQNAGAAVTVMAMGDAYTAVQTGVLDGVATALAGYNTMKGWEIAPYVTWAKGLNVSTQQLVVVNAKIWDSFPADIKASIARAEARHRQWDAEYLAKWKEEAVERFKQNGSTVTILEPEEARKWRESYVQIGLPYYLKSGEEARRILEIAEKALGRKILPTSN